MDPRTTYPQGVLDVWGAGQLLAFSGVDGPTPYAHSLVLRTAPTGCGFLVNLPGEAALQLADSPPTRTFLSGDVFDLAHSAGRTRGAFVDGCHLLIDGPCDVRSCDSQIKVARDGSRTLIGAAAMFDPGRIRADLDATIQERLRWIKSVPRPRVEGLWANKTLTKCMSVLKTAVYSPEARIKHRYTTPDRWPHRGMWLWDSAFHAVGYRHLDPALARDAIDAVLDGQHEDGMVQITFIHGTGRVPMTQPPTLTMAAHFVNQAQASADWVAAIFPKLARYLEWDMANRDTDGDGLVEWDIEPKAQCRCGESGWDNSPRFDAARRLNAVDFNAFLAWECELLAGFARLLGRHDDAARWSGHHQRLCRLMNQKLWNEQHGIYMDAFAGTGQQQPMLTGAGFLPLVCGAPSKEQARRLAAHLHDPRTFATPLPVASVPPVEREHYSKDMWRGPVWVNINWVIARGLARYGLHDEARLIRDRTLGAIEKYYRQHGAIFEFFDDEDRVPPPQLLRKQSNNPNEWIHQVIHDYSWTAALYIQMQSEMGGQA
jgi:hypothetical protein